MRAFALLFLVLLELIDAATEGTVAKVAFITAIYGGYDGSCKKVEKQSIETDLYCFSDNAEITNKGNAWSVSTTPYHITHPSKLDNGRYHNSLVNGINNSTFNIAKYYKQQWQLIPALSKYEVVVWLDGSIEITSAFTAEILLGMLEVEDRDVLTWEQSQRHGVLMEEVNASKFDRYAGQDLEGQYQAYMEDGYSDQVWKNLDHADASREHFGVWFTAMVAFRNGVKAHRVLDHWYLQTLRYTTQDQVSLPYSLWKTKTVPITLPKGQIRGNYDRSNVHIKRPHGLPQLMADISGGLGNQLFMVSHAIAYSLMHNTSYCFVSRMALGPTHRRNYWNTLFLPVSHLVIDGTNIGVEAYYYAGDASDSGNGGDSSSVAEKRVAIHIAGQHDQDFPLFLEQPPPLHSSMAPASFSEDHFYTIGYFQSPEAFGSEWSRVSAILGLDSRRRETRGLLADLALPFEHSVALHFRLGDFRRFPKKHPVLPLSYYRKGLERIVQEAGRDDLTVLCFYEDGEKAAAGDRIAVLRAAFPSMHFVSFSDMSAPLQMQDWQEMLAMSLCAFQIIANSTFSWWAAFLNDLSTKIVVYPTSIAAHSTNIVPRAPGLGGTPTTADPRWIEMKTDTIFEDFYLHFEDTGTEATLSLPNFREMSAAEIGTYVNLFCGHNDIGEEACAQVKRAVFARTDPSPAGTTATSTCSPASLETCHELERERAGAITRELGGATLEGTTTGVGIPAYVITTSTSQPRAQQTMHLLGGLGFSVTPVLAQPPLTSSALSKVWSNRNTIITTLQLHLRHSSSDWAYIFEDDIAVAAVDVSAVEVSHFSSSSHSQFQYLGVCVPPYHIQAGENYGTSACGRCAHAMAISKKGIADLLDFVTTSARPDFFGEVPQQQPYFDVIVESWCNERSDGGFPVLQGHIISPQDESHRGAFYQDRQRWQTTIG